MTDFEEFDKIFQRCTKFTTSPDRLLGLLTAEGPALLVQGLGKGNFRFIQIGAPTDGQPLR